MAAKDEAKIPPEELETKEGEDPNCNLIVNYLPPTVAEGDLRRLFETHGSISQVKVVRDKHLGHSLGYGFIKFEGAEGASAAVSAMNGYTLDNKKLKVSVARPQSKEIVKSNLYISGLPPSWTKAELDQLFSEYGKVIESRVLYDPATKQSRGVGFCRVDTHQNALKAIAALNGATPTGGSSKLIVKLADPPKATRKFVGYGPIQQPLQSSSYRFNPLGTRLGFGFPGLYQGGMNYGQQDKKDFQGICLFIYHLPLECDEPTLHQLFSNFGTVLSTRVMKDLQTGYSKGFGFVNMMTDQQAQAAIIGLNGFQLGGKYLKVSYKK
jgi:RNA recognition motif-containing protein